MPRAINRHGQFIADFYMSQIRDTIYSVRFSKLRAAEKAQNMPVYPGNHERRVFMKMKKTVSTIAALAITISAFAGLGITANAATVEKSFIGSSTAAETFDNYDGTGWGSTAGDFSSSASGNTHFGIVNIPEIEKPDMGESISDGIYPTYVSGNTLSTQVRGKTYANSTYTFPSVVYNGKLYFETDVYSHSDETNPYGMSLTFADSDGNTVARASLDSAVDSYLRLYNSDDTLLNRTGNAMKFRSINDMGYHIGLVFDLDNDTVTLTADYIISSSGIRSDALLNPDSQTLTIDNIASFSISYTGHSSSNNFQCAIDNVKLYADVETESATSLTVNYVSNGSPIAEPSELDISTMSVGDNYTYYYPAYITGSDGTVYKAATDLYGATRSIAAAEDSVDVEYTPLSSAAQFKDYDGRDPYNQDKASVSNGSVGAIGNSTWDAITVAQNGKYDITINAVRVANDNYRSGNVLVDGKVVGSISYNGTVQTISDIDIAAGSVISVSGNNSKSGLDYVLIEKTGEYTPSTPEPITEDATPVESYTDDNGGKASLWEAELELDGTFTARTIQASVTDNNSTTKTSEPKEITNITTEGSVFAAIVVNGRTEDEIESVTVTLN